MEQQITNEVRAKIFALYLGSTLMWGLEKYNMTLSGICGDKLFVSPKYDSNYFREVPMNGSQLLLKPLSSISDEDIEAILKILIPNKNIYSFKNQFQVIDKDDNTLIINDIYGEIRFDWDSGNVTYLNNIKNSFNPTASLYIADYLRSKGYMLPAYGISDLFEAGIAIDKTKL